MAVRSIQLQEFAATRGADVLGAGQEFGFTQSSIANIKSYKGFAAPSYRVPRYNLPNRNGVKIVNTLHGERNLSFLFELYSSDEAVFDGMKSKLSEACDPNLGVQTMTIKTHTGNIYEIDGAVDLLESTNVRNTNYEAFTMNFVCEGEHFFDLGLDGIGQTQTISLYDSLQGLEYSVENGGAEYSVANDGAEYSLGNLANRTVNNDGAARVYPVIRIGGYVNRPYVRNETNNMIIKVNTELEVGEYIDIDMDEQTVTTDEGIDITALVDAIQADFFLLEQGDNVLTFGHDGQPNDDAYCRVAWAPAVNIL